MFSYDDILIIALNWKISYFDFCSELLYIEPMITVTVRKTDPIFLFPCG